MTAQHHGRHGRPWRRIRLAILARDPLCTMKGPKCSGRSTTVDHIIPLAVAPELAHEWSNLRGACKSCNSAGGADMTNGKHNPKPSQEW